MKNPFNILEKATARNEPVFVLRAQDLLSMCALSAYVNAAAVNGEISSEQYEELSTIYNQFQDWQDNNSNLVKIPD